jgi:hypothetical protein
LRAGRLDVAHCTENSGKIFGARTKVTIPTSAAQSVAAATLPQGSALRRRSRSTRARHYCDGKMALHESARDVISNGNRLRRLEWWISPTLYRSPIPLLCQIMDILEHPDDTDCHFDDVSQCAEIKRGGAHPGDQGSHRKKKRKATQMCARPCAGWPATLQRFCPPGPLSLVVYYSLSTSHARLEAPRPRSQPPQPRTLFL